MLFNRQIFILVTAILTLITFGRDVLAQKEPSSEKNQVEGPQKPGSDSNISMKTRLQTKPSPDIKDDPEFKAYSRLRTAGLVFTAAGGLSITAGSVLIGVSPWDYGAFGGVLILAGGFLFLLPGTFMAIAGHQNMRQIREMKSSYRKRTSYRPQFQGVSFLASSSRNRTNGLAVNFTF